jgi:formate hydrogenlyase transcriptional activator
VESALRPPVQQAASEDGVAFERLLADLSARFVSVAPAAVDGQIEQALRRIVEALGVDRSSLMEFSEDSRELIFTHQWAREPVRLDPDRDVRKVMSHDSPWYFGKLLMGETIAVSRLPDDLPDEAVIDKAYCLATGFAANLTVPLKLSGRPVAAVAVGCFGRERQWPAALIPRLRLIGEVFLNALARRDQALRLQQALTEIRALKAQLEEENLYLRKEIDAAARVGGIVGESAAIRRALVQAEQVAPTDAAVLLLGETGTGKELLAHTIHATSGRRARAMVRLNCAALPPTLIESELFGRERGAYTGALARQTGRFETADGSTIFLDEIGDLPLELQAKLLHVLERGEFERLGSSKTIRVDVRVIAATNRDLARMVRDGKFREDLYYRLNVFPITVPPLRARADDVPLLVWAFVREFAQKQGKAFEQIPKRAMEVLRCYSWPGNVRELRNVIERAVILSPGPILHVEPPTSSTIEAQAAGTLEAVERQHIARVLEEVHGRIRGEGGAAQRLGLKPSTLESRLVKLGFKR